MEIIYQYEQKILFIKFKLFWHWNNIIKHAEMKNHCHFILIQV